MELIQRLTGWNKDMPDNVDVSIGIIEDNGKKLFNGMIKALVICMVVSVLDQSVKIFVPVRHFDVIDIGFDAIGAVIGIGVVSIIGFVKSRRA